MTDVFAAYEHGLAELLKQLGKDHPLYIEVLTLQVRLRENLNGIREYGDDENGRASRARIIGSLNRLALDAVGVSFNDLCQDGDQAGLSVHESELDKQNTSITLAGRHRIDLLALLTNHYTLDGIKTICFVLEPEIPGIDYSSLPGEELEGKTRELIRAAEKAGKLGVLLDLINEQRPDLIDELSAIRTVANRERLQSICRRVVKRLFLDEDWQLIDNIGPFMAAVFDKTLSILPDNCSERQAARAFEKTAKNLYYDVLAERLQTQASHQLDRAYKELYNYLYDIALHRVSSRELAEEIAQEALVKVWSGLDRTLDSRGFLAWAQLIVARQIMSLATCSECNMREPNSAFGTVLRDVVTLPPLLVSEDPEQAMLTEELRSSLVQAIKSELTSEEEQKVILLTFLEGKSSSEIAEDIDISPSRVYLLRSRALQRLRASQDLRDLMHLWLEK